MMKYALGALPFLVMASPVAAQGPATPLFAADAPIALTISGPINAIARTRTPRDGTIALTGGADANAARFSPRGITRLRKETCQFPPLRVEFTQPPAATSMFAGQRRLKLVTHCRSSADFQQHVLLEYAAYRIFNLISPLSFRARLATIDYVEPDGRPLTSRYGFFIEDFDDVARRNGLKQARVGDRIPSVQLEARQSARFAMFEYMIGNLDWSMRAGPEGDGCCHNGRLLAGMGAYYAPVPYDFDFSGLVNAPYAVPPDGFGISSVRSRVYQGYCRHNGLALQAASEIRAKRPAIEAMFSQIPGMEERTRRGAIAYLGRFFDDIASDASVQNRVFRKCVG